MQSTAVARTSNEQPQLPAMLSPEALLARLGKIETAVAQSMKVDIDYGTVPGTPKPTLYKSGAEKLCTLFQIAPDYVAEEVRGVDGYTVRVKCIGRHQLTDATLGSGMGEASSNEAKWKWRRPVCDEEFEATPEDRRRVKWNRGKEGKGYPEKQVRTEPDDLRNTVLKMACKRAQIAMVLNVTNASAIFLQDLEEMPEEIREQLMQAERDRRSSYQKGKQQQAPASNNTAQRSAPQAKANAPELVTDNQVKHLLRKLDEAGMAAEQLCTKFGIKAVAELRFDDLNKALDFIKDPEREAIQAQAGEGESK